MGLGKRQFTVVACLWGCTPFASGGDALETVAAVETAQPAATPAENDDPWGCLGTLQTPGLDQPIAGQVGDQVSLRVRYHNQGAQTPVTEATRVRVCNLAEIDCADPVQDWVDLPNSGEFRALLPWGFTGYLEVDSEGFLPQLTLLDTPIYRDLELYSHSLVPVALFELFAQTLNVELNPNLGLVGVFALDCNGAFAAGVTLSPNVEDFGVPFITTQGIPTTEEAATTADGGSGYANVEPGLARLSAYNAEGRKFDEQTFIVRPGTHTLSYMRPMVRSVPELCGAGESLPQPGTVASIGAIQACDD